MIRRLLMMSALCAMVLQVAAQDVSRIEFCDKKYEYGVGKDSITLFMKVMDSEGNSCKDLSPTDLEKYLVVYEDKAIIAPTDGTSRLSRLVSASPATSPFPCWLI